MANISQPYWRIRKFKPSKDDYAKKVHRAYARINGKFVPVGYFVEWSNRSESLILDSELED